MNMRREILNYVGNTPGLVPYRDIVHTLESKGFNVKAHSSKISALLANATKTGHLLRFGKPLRYVYSATDKTLTNARKKRDTAKPVEKTSPKIVAERIAKIKSLAVMPRPSSPKVLIDVGADIQQFIASGGKITRLKPNVCSNPLRYDHTDRSIPATKRPRHKLTLKSLDAKTSREATLA